MQLDTVVLPDDLFWSAEFDWVPVGQVLKRSVTGVMVFQEQQMVHGRPVVLEGGESAGWVRRSVVMALHGLASQVDKVMVLRLPDASELSVRFDRSSGAPVEARQVMPIANPSADDWYYVTIRLITVG